MAYTRLQPEKSSTRSLWFGLLSGPVVWSLHFLAVYSLVEVGCKTPLLEFTIFGFSAVNAVVVAATVVAALVTAYAAFVAYGNWRRLAREQGLPAERRFTEERNPFMAFAGILLSVLFTAMIILTGVPALILRPCG